jgi:hypothetical protein
LKGLIEIFDRKEKHENALEVLQKEARTAENQADIEEGKVFLERFNKELQDEIRTFKLEREEDLLRIMKKFFKDKADNAKEIAKIFTI